VPPKLQYKISKYIFEMQEAKYWTVLTYSLYCNCQLIFQAMNLWVQS